jgi:ferredoxin
MKLITEQKPLDEIIRVTGKLQKVFIAGCGNCAMMCHTGGQKEVLQMKDSLEEAGKAVTGWMVIPMACDEMTEDAIEENHKAMENADVILVMSCAFGVQTLGGRTEKPVFPALNTMFVGVLEGPEKFIELCAQCGECVLADTGGICPLTACPKGLLNGPCGGTSDGNCEVSPDIKCCWVRIYEKMKKMGRLEELSETTIEAKDWSRAQKPRSFSIKEVAK